MNNRFSEILEAERLLGWKVVIINSGGGLCNFKSRELWIDEKYKNGLSMFLHEVAHAMRGKNAKQHDVFWGDLYTSLVYKYMDGKEAK